MALNKNPRSSNHIPALDDERIKSLFNRKDPDWKPIEHVIQIANQNTLSGETYDQLQSLTSEALPISRVEFIRVWKSFVLMRVQDIYENQYFTKPENYLNFDRRSLVPAPLFDLLHSLGSFYSACSGRDHFIIPPVKDVNAEDYWTIEENHLENWKAACDLMRSRYTFKEYPSPQDTFERSIIVTYKKSIGGQVSIKALTNEPVPEDAFIRFVNDELFAPHNFFNYDGCSLYMVNNVNEVGIRGNYIASYILKTRASPASRVILIPKSLNGNKKEKHILPNSLSFMS